MSPALTTGLAAVRRRRARATFLGTGTSHGVPMIGCACAVCCSPDARDRRLRTSLYLAVDEGPRLLIDTSTDLRQQALANDIHRIDAVLFTHAHADHVMGFDELRRFNTLQGGTIPCFASASTWRDLQTTFHYAFRAPPGQGGGVPRVDVHTIEGPFVAAGVSVVPVPLCHGRTEVLGFRSGGFAYLTDCNGVAEQSWELLQGLDVLVLDALRFDPHDTHYTFDEALAVVDQLAPRQTYFVHMGHEIGHAAVSAQLPAGIELAYDGLAIDLLVDAA